MLKSDLQYLFLQKSVLLGAVTTCTEPAVIAIECALTEIPEITWEHYLNSAQNPQKSPRIPYYTYDSRRFINVLEPTFNTFSTKSFCRGSVWMIKLKGGRKEHVIFSNINYILPQFGDKGSSSSPSSCSPSKPKSPLTKRKE